MRTILIAWLVLLLVSPALAVNSWVSRTSSTTQNLNDVQFISTSTGVAVGNQQTIIRTTNFGKTWSIISESALANNFRGLNFPTTTTLIGYAAGTASGGGGYLSKSTDGGASWAFVPTDISVLYDIYFSDALTGWAATSAAVNLFWKSVDGGASWNVKDTGLTAERSYYGVFFVDTQTGWLVGSPGLIFKTANGADLWTAQVSGTANQLNDVYFINSTKGWIVGNGGTILKTVDGGTTWTAQVSGTANLNAVYFVDVSNGWAVGDSGTILKTTDGGASWVPEASGTTNNLYGVHFVNATNGCAVGAGGVILKYSAVPVITNVKRGRYDFFANNSFNRSVTITGTDFDNPAVTFDTDKITGGGITSSTGTEIILPVSVDSVVSGIVPVTHVVTVTNQNGAGASGTFSLLVYPDAAGPSISISSVNGGTYTAGMSLPSGFTVKGTIYDITGLSNDELDFNFLFNTTATARPPKYYKSFSAPDFDLSTGNYTATVNMVKNFETGEEVPLATAVGYNTTFYQYISAKDQDGNEGTAEMNIKLTGLQPGKGVTNIYQSPNKNPTVTNPIIVQCEVKDPTLTGIKEVPIVGMGGTVARFTRTFVLGTNNIKWDGMTNQGGTVANGMYRMLLPGGFSAKVVVLHQR